MPRQENEITATELRHAFREGKLTPVEYDKMMRFLNAGNARWWVGRQLGPYPHSPERNQDPGR